MPPTPYDPIGTVQQAITNLLATQLPQFLGIGNRMFTSFATILLVWQGLRMMLAWRESGEHMFSFAKLMLMIAFGEGMIVYYASPIPGFGESFSSLITNEALTLARLISGQSIQDAQQSLNTLWNSLEQPDAWSILANLLYWLMLIVIGLAQFALMFVISFSMIASAVCGLVGPIFVPFFIVPTLEWLFWGWLKAFIQYSFMIVIANAFIFVFEKFLSRYLQTLPPGLRFEDQLLYGVHAVMILGTFTVGVLLVPSLTSSIFSGRSGESVLPSQIRSV
ncbi:MAG TPA: type IV secretion system protein [Vicinamibacterales bacterium]|nr:type IV secretion system protein [Vicinamibacterales bacterium]